MRTVFIALFFVFVSTVSFSQPQPCDSLKKTVETTQNFLMPDINIVAFGGAWANSKNMNNFGSFNGVYFDIGLTKKESLSPTYSAWQLALFGLASWSRFEDNMSYYSANSNEIGGGLAFGYYSEAVFRPLFVGISLGLMNATDQGKSVQSVGVYSREQSDWLLALGLNIQLISGDKWLSRTQIDIKWEKPLMTSVSGYWNKNVIQGVSPWNREYIDVSLRQSVVNIQWNQRIMVVPKLILRYSHSVGSNQNAYGIGVELGVKRIGQDDVLSLYYIFNLTNKISMVGAKINFALL